MSAYAWRYGRLLLLFLIAGTGHDFQEIEEPNVCLLQHHRKVTSEALTLPSARASQWQTGDTTAFPKYNVRKVYSLDGYWNFSFLGDVNFSIVSQAMVEGSQVTWTQVSVPDAFDARDWLCHPPNTATEVKCPGWADQPCGNCCYTSDGSEGNSQCWVGTAAAAGGYSSCCDSSAMGRRGVAVYRTELPPGVSLLHFRACAFRCRVLVNGAVVGEHAGGYSPFWVKIPGLLNQDYGTQEQELLVFVDNRFDSAVPVHNQRFDFYQPGGLLRTVEAHAPPQPTLYIDRAFVSPVDAGPGHGAPTSVRLTVSVSEVCSNQGLSVSVSIDGVLIQTRSLSQCQNETWQQEVPSPEPWTVASPVLHNLTLGLLRGTQALDEVTVRFGLRSVRAENGRILMNDEPIILQGVNRHESNPDGGIFLTDAELAQDIQFLNELGVNFVRGTHYSQDQRFLDLADENGVLVWEETLAWGTTVEEMTNPLFMEQQKQALEETIQASKNHPCVIMWGFLNEAESNDTRSLPAFTTLRDLAKSMDSTRLVSWASKQQQQDLTLSMADVISFNGYPGWYPVGTSPIPIPALIPEYWFNNSAWVTTHFPGKPFLVSETGADALAGFLNNDTLQIWTENYQVSVVAANIAAVFGGGFAGITLFEYADSMVDWDAMTAGQNWTQQLSVKRQWVNGTDWMEEVAVQYSTTLVSSNGSYLLLRPRHMNNKGLVSITRGHQKLSFDRVSQAFSGNCSLLTIANRTQPLPAVPGWSSPAALTVSRIPSLAPGAGVFCEGCLLSAWIYNLTLAMDTPDGVGVLATNYTDPLFLWQLSPGGFITVSTAGTEGGPWGFLSAGPKRDADTTYVAIKPMVSELWQAQVSAVADDSSWMDVTLRIVFGQECGSYLTVMNSIELFEDVEVPSVDVAVVHNVSEATTWRILLPSTWQGAL